MRLATWNVNSIRSRADRVAAFLQRHDVDVLALQETKCRDDQFPEMMFNAIGYEVAHVGYSQWNGVAILSRVGIEDVDGRLPRPAPLGRGPVRGGAGAGRHLRRRPGVEPVRAERPRARRSAPHLQAGVARGPADDGGRLARRGPGRADRPGRRLEHRAPGRRRLGHERRSPTRPTSPSPSGRPSGASWTPGSPTSSARSPPGPGVYTYWDYVRLRFPRREGMRIDFILELPRARRAGDRCADRPRGAQGQGRQRPRPRHRRAGLTGGLRERPLALVDPPAPRRPGCRRRRDRSGSSAMQT